MHENKTNHKKYIGMTGQPPEVRWRNGNGYKSCVAFNHAVEKYGWDGFDHVILYSGLTYEESCAKEKEQIEKFDTMNPEHGYNICGGGGGMIGFHHSEETKKKIAEAMSGEKNPNYKKPLSPEHKELQLSRNLGSKHSEEHKRKIGESLKNLHRHQTEKQKQAASKAASHPVEREDGIVFGSVKEAAASIGTTYSAISNAIRRKQRSGGYLWKYVESKA